MDFIIHGDIAYCADKDNIKTIKDGYMYIENGVIKSIGDIRPDNYDVQFLDYKDKLIIPGFVDLHTHAPQYSFRGLWMDMELIDWLNQHTFPEEAKYADSVYAKEAYKIFSEDLKNSATTRAVIFATIHREATIKLMEMLEDTGVITEVGKVSMDRNCPEYISEKDLQVAISDIEYIYQEARKFLRTKAIITPRFVPTCSESLMKALGEVSTKNNMNVQSHLSENKSEIEWVKKLHPEALNYAQVYENFNLFNKCGKTIMAHCVWCDEEETRILKTWDGFIAHCPSSNANLSSGIAPIRKYIDYGINVGLGTDVAGGTDNSMIRLIPLTIQMSKLYWRLVDNSCKPLTFEEVFYMATMGGGKFFGKVGTFLPNYDADMIVLDESNLPTNLEGLDIRDRLERFIYLSNDSKVLHKFVRGRQIF